VIDFLLMVGGAFFAMIVSGIINYKKSVWVGLTDEEINEEESKKELGHGFIQGALWAEAKLKEKNT
jgi:hypothetical protein